MGKKKKSNYYVVKVPVVSTEFYDVEALDQEEALDEAKQQAENSMLTPSGEPDWDNAYIDQFSIVEFCVMVHFIDTDQFIVQASDKQSAIKEAQWQHNIDGRYDLSQEDLVVEENNASRYQWKKAAISIYKGA